jgi:hydrogenase nickel incorporation protein HypA/HybF
MHEATIAQSIIEVVAEHIKKGGYRRATRIGVKVGHLSSVVPESLEFAFQALSRGTVVERATLEIEEIDGLGRCRDCGAEFAVDSHLTVCAPCGSGNVEVTGGDDLTVDTIDVEA